MTDLALVARDTLPDLEEITAQVPVFAQNLARSLVALEELPPRSVVAPVIPPPPSSLVRAANPFPSTWTVPEEDLEEIDPEDDSTAKVPEYVRQFAEALITGEHVSARSLGIVPASSASTGPASQRAPLTAPPSGLTRRRPTMLLSASELAAAAPEKASERATVGARPSRIAVIGSLATAVLSLGFAAVTSIRSDGAATSMMARVPHVTAGGGAHACFGDFPPRPLATSAATLKKPEGVARVAPAAAKIVRRPATVAASRRPSGNIIRRNPF